MKVDLFLEFIGRKVVLWGVSASTAKILLIPRYVNVPMGASLSTKILRADAVVCNAMVRRPCPAVA